MITASSVHDVHRYYIDMTIAAAASIVVVVADYFANLSLKFPNFASSSVKFGKVQSENVVSCADGSSDCVQ